MNDGLSVNSGSVLSLTWDLEGCPPGQQIPVDAQTKHHIHTDSIQYTSNNNSQRYTLHVVVTVRCHLLEDITGIARKFTEILSLAPYTQYLP